MDRRPRSTTSRGRPAPSCWDGACSMPVPRTGWIKLGFEGKPEFCNPAGFIQGGLLSAMLDDTMGPAVLVMSEGAALHHDHQHDREFSGPAKPGPIIGEAKVTQLGKTIAFVEAKLMAEDGTVLATASASERLLEAARVVGKAAARSVSLALLAVASAEGVSRASECRETTPHPSESSHGVAPSSHKPGEVIRRPLARWNLTPSRAHPCSRSAASHSAPRPGNPRRACSSRRCLPAPSATARR